MKYMLFFLLAFSLSFSFSQNSLEEIKDSVIEGQIRDNLHTKITQTLYKEKIEKKAKKIAKVQKVKIARKIHRGGKFGKKNIKTMRAILKSKITKKVISNSMKALKIGSTVVGVVIDLMTPNTTVDDRTERKHIEEAKARAFWETWKKNNPEKAEKLYKQIQKSLYSYPTIKTKEVKKQKEIISNTHTRNNNNSSDDSSSGLTKNESNTNSTPKSEPKTSSKKLSPFQQAFKDARTHEITLIVKDEDGRKAKMSKSLTIGKVVDIITVVSSFDVGGTPHKTSISSFITRKDITNINLPISENISSNDTLYKGNNSLKVNKITNGISIEYNTWGKAPKNAFMNAGSVRIYLSQDASIRFKVIANLSAIFPISVENSSGMTFSSNIHSHNDNPGVIMDNHVYKQTLLENDNINYTKEKTIFLKAGYYSAGFVSRTSNRYDSEHNCTSTLTIIVTSTK